MSYIDLAHADRRPVQQTGLGVAVGPGMPVNAAEERLADAGQTLPDLARTPCGNCGCSCAAGAGYSSIRALVLPGRWHVLAPRGVKRWPGVAPGRGGTWTRGFITAAWLWARTGAMAGARNAGTRPGGRRSGGSWPRRWPAAGSGDASLGRTALRWQCGCCCWLQVAVRGVELTHAPGGASSSA